MNPMPLVQEHLRAGELVALLPGTTLDVELHWQCARLRGHLLDGLTRAILEVARLRLRT